MKSMDENTILHHRARFTSSSLKPQHSQNSKQAKHFPSYVDVPDLSQRVRLLCEILARDSVTDVEDALNSTGVQPHPELVEEVLKLSYGCPTSAVKFFRWVGLAHKPSTYAWNLMVDLLGKNEMFEPMWDAIRSMKQEGLLSTATFASVFGSYCVAGRFDEAFMTFNVMDKYGIEPNVVAVNSLLGAICHEENCTAKAFEFLQKIKSTIPPDADSYAILLEGWEKEGNVAKAKTTFGEMVISVGWDPQNRSAYDAFLTTLVCGSQTSEAIKFLQVMKGKNCSPGLKFFSNALDILVKQNDSAHALPLWDIMVGSGLAPNLIMYNSVIGLVCSNNDIENAFRFLDEMVFHGAFPDCFTYNMIFECLIKNNKVCEVSRFFIAMTKNECHPSHSNCAAAIEMLFDRDDPETAIGIWNYMLENEIRPIDESANALLIGLCKLGRFSELKRFANGVLDRRINISESTMGKLKNACYKEGRTARDMYNHLQLRWTSA
ncbi:hypothetical protein Nepgr_031824 [Nepenthes gracilis]|uniref:Pentatricopeptide repeat-containing protein n=1 Tax=Nepenthes gracilis TaxID=150966 RepID=A0AAD3TIV5_NEPGR|nr:hypothetical protein Nepgr_031824 [Nepenthes gracilis]